MGDDRGHALGQLADLLQVAAGVVDALVIEQHAGVVGIAADRAQRLVQLMADARRHGAQRGELAGLHHLVLGVQQLALRLFALVYFLLQALVGRLQLAGAFQHADFQLVLGLGFQFDAFQIVAAADVQQGQQQQQGQQRGAADQQDVAHRVVHQRARAVDAHRPAGLGQSAALADPVLLANPQRLRMHHRVGNVLRDLPLLRRRQLPAGTEAPRRVGRHDHHALVVLHHQLLRRVAPQPFHVFQVHLDHQHAEQPVALAHLAGEEVATPVRRRPQPEEPRQLAAQRFLVVGAEGEVVADEGVRLVPVGCGLGHAVREHQVDHVGAGAFTDFRQLAVGRGLRFLAGGLLQGCPQGRQLAQDRRQVLIAPQRAEQVGDVEVEGLPVLLGQFFAVVAVGEVVEGPEQRGQDQEQQDGGTPAGEREECHGNRRAPRQWMVQGAMGGVAWSNTSLSRRYRPWRSLSDSSGTPSRGQSMARSGSFQAMHRSSAGDQKSVVL
ncbi:hypothetical protein D3C76_804050 [compost metagenome]